MSPEKAGSLVPHSSLKSVHYTIGALAHGEVLMLQATNEQCNVCTLYVEPKPGGTKKDLCHNQKHDNQTIIII